MSDKDTGGPAFACAAVGRDTANKNDMLVVQTGMTLRDYFAAHAPEVPSWYQSGRIGTNWEEDRYFEWRRYYADMMLAERAK